MGIFAKDDVWGEVGAALLDRADNDGKPQLEVPADKGASGWLVFFADIDGKPRLEVPADKGASGWLEFPADNDGKLRLEVPADKGTFPSRCLLAYSRAMRLQACEKLRATTFMLPSNPS